MATNNSVLSSFLEVGVPRNDFKTLLQIVSAEVRERIEQHDEQVDTFSQLIGDAPELLNTLGEISDAIGDDPQFIATLANQISELNTDVTATVTAIGIAENDTSMGAFSESVLPDDVDLKTVLEAFADAWRTAKENIEAAAGTIETNLATEVTDRTNADSALSDRLDVLEADPTTQTLLDAEATARDNADNALDVRLDALELDPTTQTLLDAEATARENADSALSDRLNVLEADPITATDAASADATVLSTANAYTDTSITNLVNGADLALDTLKEIGDALQQGDDDVTTALTNQITTEATTRANADTALSDRLDVLELDPTTQTLLDAEATARGNADTALSNRLDVLEADPTTQTLLDAEATARSDADTALDGRLDVLELDPTTQAAVDAKLDASAVSTFGGTLIDDADAATARTTLGLGDVATTAVADYATAAQGALADTAVQPAAISNVDNTSDADKPVSTATQTALDAKAPLADPDFTGVLEVDTNARLEFDSNLTKLHNVLRSTSITIGNNITLNPAAANGRVEIEGEFYLRPSDLTDAADDTAAAAAGIIVGQVYRNGSQLMVRVS